jgi:hypothetical protein
MVWCSTQFKALNPKYKNELNFTYVFYIESKGKKLSKNLKLYHMLLNGKLHLMMNMHLPSKTKHGHWWPSS